MSLPTWVRHDPTLPDKDRWFACQYPERPYAPSIQWHLDPSFCRACHVRYQVDRLHMPDRHRLFMDTAMGAVA